MNARLICYNILYDVIYNGGYANLLLRKWLKNIDNKSDISLVTNIVYGSIKNYDLLKYQLEHLDYKKISNKQLIIILIAMYQYYFLDKIPKYAIISETNKLSKAILNDNYQLKFINALLNKLLLNKLTYYQDSDILKEMSINYSQPLWYLKMLNKQLGIDRTKKIVIENNQVSKIFLRYNILANSYQEIIKDDNIKILDDDKNIFEYKNNDIFNYSFYQNGDVSVQDYSAIKVGYFLNPKANTKVLDMCAAPGNKTCHLAQLMHNKGLIKAYDIHYHRVELIKKEAKRLKIDIIDANCCDATKLSDKEKDNSFDYILCDAPCTGLGVLKRKPEIKFNNINNKMDEIIKVQASLLENAYCLLKKNGVLVYATCTNNKKENEYQVQELLKKHHDLRLIDECNIYNYEYNSDGFYMAKIVKI